MNKRIAIGVDIGGSHVISAAVDLDSLEILKGTTFSNKVNSKDTCENILIDWCKAINQTIESISPMEKINIGFAMPGPFQYKSGVALFNGNDKYENLFNVSIPEELPRYLRNINSCELRFLNDATAFGVGCSAMGEAKHYNKVIALTLGTGFGSCFIKNGIPQVNTDDVAEGGCLWNKSYQEGIGDDYFSTRWCLKRYKELSSKDVKGAKEIASANDEFAKTVFYEFGANMAEFIIPFMQKFHPELIILGGNISNANHLFLPILKEKIAAAGLEVDFAISGLMEDAAIIGSAKLFNPEFWNQVKEDLPTS